MPTSDPEKRKKHNAKYFAKHYAANKDFWRAKHYEKSSRAAKFVQDYKASHPCPCGQDHPAALVFHHRDPSTKLFEIATMVNKRHGLKKIEAEIEKCNVMCANCHAILHWEMKQAEKLVK